MAKFVVGKGLDNYIAYLQKINLLSSDMVGEAVYDMAKVVADKVRANIEALPAAPKGKTTYHVTETRIMSELSQEQKKRIARRFWRQRHAE